MSKEIAKQDGVTDLSVMEKVVVMGDLSPLSPEERFLYYTKVCESVGLNPLTKPFDYIQLNGELRLYAKKDATDQLRKIHKVSTVIKARERVDDVFIVTALGNSPDGRQDEAIGAVPLLKWETKWDAQTRKVKRTGQLVALNAEEYANAVMKAETKAKRRVTLSLVGLGMLDETELETIQDNDGERVIINDEQQVTQPVAVETPKNDEPSNPAKSQPETVKQTGDVNTEKLYKIVDAKAGQTGQGTDYLLITAVNQDEEKVQAYANNPELISAVNELDNDSEFKMDYTRENGINVIQNIEAVENLASTASTSVENNFKLIDSKEGKAPSGVPYVQLKVQNLIENSPDTLLVRDKGLFHLVSSINKGESFAATIEIQNGFKVVTGLPA